VRKWFGMRGHLISEDVAYLAYVHLHTRYQGLYVHDFESTGVELWALSNGGLLIRHPRYRLWNDYVVSEDT
jgi:hypothetical protein